MESFSLNSNSAYKNRNTLPKLTTIPEETYSSAREFLDAIRMTNSRWISAQNKWERAWVFRGQANADWPLVPSAWRTNNLGRFKSKYRAKFQAHHNAILEREYVGINTEIELGHFSESEAEKQRSERSSQELRSLEQNLQYFSEMRAVKEFTDFADRLGYPVPGAEQFFTPIQRNYMDLPEEDYLISQFVMWTSLNNPFNVNCTAVALAQHHGVPTRLLDWTENPLIAAFFAADAFTSDKIKTGDPTKSVERIAVWAISKDVFSNNEPDSEKPTSLQMITRPRHEISYLLAQEALFTHDKGANDHFQRTGVWRSVEEVLDNNLVPLKKLTLPVNEVGELIRLLWLQGISRAHLMPTYDNVTHALETRAWWENKNV